MSGETGSAVKNAGVSSRLIDGGSVFYCVVLSGANGGSGSPDLISPLGEYLISRGIRVEILSDFPFSDGHCAERFEQLARECLFGVLVPGSAGPDELYQFGFLKGLGKFVLALGHDASAAWEAKGIRYDPDEEPMGAAAGIEGVRYRDGFILRRLPGPARTGWDAVSSENADTEFLKCLGEALPGIIESYMSEPPGGVSPEERDDLQTLSELTHRLSGYFASREGFGITELEALYGALGAWEENTGLGAPSRVLGCLASLYSGLAECSAPEEALRAERCITLYEKILEREKPGALTGASARNLADLLLMRVPAGDAQGVHERAAGLYRQALETFTLEIHPREFTEVSNNLGAALNTLYSVTGDPGYAKEAVRVLEACVSQSEFMNPQSDLAIVNINLGTAYADIALHEDMHANYLKAAGSFEDALGLMSARGDSGESASVRAVLGDIYKALGDGEAESDDPDAAIEFYDRALIHYPEETARRVHASNGRKLGESFERLYRSGGVTEDLRKAIAAFSAAISAAGDAGGDGCADIARTLTSLYSELAETLEGSGDYEGSVEALRGALSVFDPAGRPLEYAVMHVRIGGLYRKMAWSWERELNTELAVESYKEALSLIDEDAYGEMRGELCGLAGGLLFELASAEAEDPNKRIGFYKEALEYLDPDGHPLEFARAQKGLGDIYMTLYRAAGERRFPALAAEAFGEALRVFSSGEHSEEYQAAEAALGEARNIISELESAESSETPDAAGPADGGVRDEAPAERPLLSIVKDEEQEAETHQGPEDRDTEHGSPEDSIVRCMERLRKVSKADSPAEYASLKLDLGRAYTTLGDRAVDGKANYYRRALGAHEESLAFYEPDEYPDEHSSAASGAAYSWMRIAEQTGDSRGFDRAIALYRQAIAAINPDSSPREWGTAKENLGNIYRTLAEMKGDKEGYRKSLAEYKDALAVFTPGESMQDYGRIAKNIGFIHGILAGLEDSGPDYSEAVEAFTGALEAFGPESSPDEYAEIHKLLGIALAGIARKEDSPEYYRRAVESWGKALGIEGRETPPRDYGFIMKNTGAAHERIYGYSDDPEDLKAAAMSYQEALGYYNYKFMPADYASISSGLGAVYKRLAESEDATENCRKALRCYEGALRVYNINDYPLEYAATQHNLGVIYRTLAGQEEKGKNCKRAVNAYREALRVYTEKEHPAQYGSTKYNLGTAYMTLAEAEERDANCRMSVKAFEDALRVRTIQNYPMQFAATQNNLGVVYRMLSETEDRAKNCRKAINAYETALAIYTIERFPLQFATTQNNIGGAYTTLAGEEDRTRNLDRASLAYQEALRVFTKNSYPAQYGIVKANLELLSEFSGIDASSAAS